MYQAGDQAAVREPLLPLPCSRENSARNAIATGMSMPTPMPITKRAAISVHTSCATAHTSAVATKKSMFAMKTR